MEEYFLRQYELWGEDTQEKLKDKSVAIIGCGGLGSNLAIALGSSGIGRVYLVDYDTVALHNIHRQIAFRIEDIRKPKAKLLSMLLTSRYYGVNVSSHICSFDEFVKKNYDFDIILDATDNLPTRESIDRYAKKIAKPWIYASVEEWYGQVCFVKDCSFTKGIMVHDREPYGITAPIVSFIASYQSTMALRYLAGLPVKFDMLNYLYFDGEGDLKIKKYNMPS